jgi:hypothetical protein
MVVTQSSAAFTAPNGETRFRIFGLGWMEVLLQICNHSITWITVRSQEGMIVAYAVKALPNAFLAEIFILVTIRKYFDSAFFGLYILLDFATGSPF